MLPLPSQVMHNEAMAFQNPTTLPRDSTLLLAPWAPCGSSLVPAWLRAGGEDVIPVFQLAVRGQHLAGPRGTKSKCLILSKLICDSWKLCFCACSSQGSCWCPGSRHGGWDGPRGCSCPVTGKIAGNKPCIEPSSCMFTPEMLRMAHPLSGL